MKILIKREDKNIWEKRTPLIPADVAYLTRKYDINFEVQHSHNRIFSDEEYYNAGASIIHDIETSDADIILGVKEIHIEHIKKNKTYIFFSHTIKGQPHNMPMLKQLINNKANLIDYERIVNEKNQRLIFFGTYAGKAGMIETLHALGTKLELKGIDSPFTGIKQAYEYLNIDEAVEAVKSIGNIITTVGLDEKICPLVFGFAGYGNVSKGAQYIFDNLPYIQIEPDELLSDNYLSADIRHNLIKVVFKEEHTVKPVKGVFNLQDYFSNPRNYISNFDRFIPYLSVLINCIFWSNENPRLITKKYLSENTDLKLIVIGDISCDLFGGIEITDRVTTPDQPTYTYFPEHDRYLDATEASGITIMAIDNLPCEFPRDASISFSSVLREFIPSVYYTDFSKSFENLELSEPLKKALILHNGEFTPDYKYMEEFLNE